MALNLKSSIFDADPDAKPREPVTYEGPAFSVISYEYNKEENRPERLDGWGFQVARPDDAGAVQELYGGRSVDLDHKRYTTGVYTDCTSLNVVITDVESDMKLWNGSTLVHHCTGTHFLSDPPGKGVKGDECGCPETIRERKTAAKDKWGPRPDIRVRFQLADDRELGTGEMKTGSWDLSGELESYLAAKLADAEKRDPSGEIAAELYIKTVEYVSKSGPRKGKTTSYQYPSLRNIRALNDAVTED